MLGKIPANRSTRPGLAILNRYPTPNLTQAAGTNYNYEIDAGPTLPTRQLLQQPAIRLDYQLSSKLRVTGKYSGQRQARADDARASIPGFTDVLSPYPFITNYAVTANYTLTPTTFLEGTYGFIRNELTGGNDERHPRSNDSAEPAQRPGRRSRCSIPNAGIVPTGVLRVRGPAGRQAAVLGRHQAEPAADVHLGRPHRRARRRTSATRAG